MSRRTWLRSAAAAATLVACGGRDAARRIQTETRARPTGRLVLAGGRVFIDGQFKRASLVLEGARIVGVDAAATAEPGDVDCTALWLLPGFIDAHVHLQFSRPAEVLAGGVTTVRDLGSPPEVGLALVGGRGLRVRSVGQILTAVGGYPSQSWGSDGTSREVLGPDDADDAVAEQARGGATVIKVALEPAVGPMFDAATLAAVVAAAQRRGLPVTAHVGAPEALRLALDAGVDELAHLPLYDVTPAEMESVAAAGVIVVPTLQVHGAGGGGDALAAFRRAGGVVVFGSDLGNTGTSAGIEVDEVAALQDAGMTPTEVIAAATSVAADHLGLAKVGRLQPGFAADVVAVRQSPLDDPAAYDDIAFVIAGGEVVGGSLDGT